jgi:putative RecB family exonuclease
MAAAKKQPLAWSYSRLADYEKCPQLFKFKVIEKRPEPSNEYMERGGRIHEQAQVCLMKPKSKIPADLKRVAAEIKLLRSLKAEPEGMLSFTDQFKKKTTWFGKDAWARVKVDATARVTYLEALEQIAPNEVHWGQRGQLDKLTPGVWVVDWKTGQFKPERSTDQVELYALGAYLDDSVAEFVIVSLVYVDFGRTVHAYFDLSKKQLERLKQKWLKKVAPMQADTRFKPKPGVQCDWCFFSKKKGGPCLAG